MFGIVESFLIVRGLILVIFGYFGSVLVASVIPAVGLTRFFWKFKLRKSAKSILSWQSRHFELEKSETFISLPSESTSLNAARILRDFPLLAGSPKCI